MDAILFFLKKMFKYGFYICIIVVKYDVLILIFILIATFVRAFQFCFESIMKGLHALFPGLIPIGEDDQDESLR